MVLRGDHAQSAAEQRYRQAIRDANVRFIVLPSQERRGLARALLERLGAVVRDEGRLLVGEFADSTEDVESIGENE
jgi:GNAT superfamily N-acetyltransferase